MALLGEQFSETFHWWATLLYGVTMLYALRLAYWPRLKNAEQTHVFFGACVVLLLLWQVEAPVNTGLSFHLLGVTTITLMFGWSFAVIGSTIALVGVTLNAGQSWQGFALNAIVMGVLPATLSQFILVLVRSLLPKNFFIFVLVNGFLTAGFVAVVSGYLAVGLLMWNGSFSMLELEQNVISFFPLMFLPEAMLNGWLITIMVLYRPEWVSSFSDELYLKGK
ncbi:MAG: molecular chaperone DnaJ [Gammaproteobacteria bacterium]|nr:molecular chaperone DnaJ [Gammaproteobacteria bacterium]